ncbi:hypothetical protein N9140_01005 [bacterium]|nr:hypothetical protein [bacterium]
MSFKCVDSIIIQFIKKEENRALLGKFVWAYFNRICGSVGCTCCLNNSSSTKGDDDNNNNLHIEKNRKNPPLASPSVLASEYADNLLKEMGKSDFDTGVGGEEPSYPPSRCKCSLPPLYLQWDGHSVTVIGVKRIIGINNSNGQQGPPPSYTLIIFCPQKKLGTIKCQLAKELHSRKNTTNGNGSSISSSTAAAATTTTTQPYSFGARIESLIELPADKLLHKDCQLLLSTAKVIDENESNRRKSCIQNIGFLNATAPK